MAISLCMIVKNEAASLPGCLGSAAAWVDEIIVVDTGSTDATVDIARQYDAQVLTFDWTDDFAAARNMGLRAAQGKWILVLDADEQLTPAVGEQLQIISRGGSVQGIPACELLAANLLRREESAQQAPFTLITRFFRNLEAIEYQRPYHETVDDSLDRLRSQDQRWRIITLPGTAITHTGYRQEAIAQAQKFQRAARIMEGYLQDHPDDSYMLNKLGALYVQRGDLPQGVELLERGIASVAADDIHTRFELHYHLGLAHRALQQSELAANHYQASLQLPVAAPIKLSSHINLGSLFKQTGELSEAMGQFQQAIAIDSACAIAHFNLGVIHRAQGNLEAAVIAYRRAIQHQPDYGEAYQNLGVALYKQGYFIDCAKAFRAAVDCYETSKPVAAAKLREGIRNLGLPPAVLAEVHLL